MADKIGCAENDSAADASHEESGVSMVEVLEEEQQLEEESNAVLGGSDAHNCTYDMGYVLRQALYACATCRTEGTDAGVCLACSYDCHEGHQLYELYTKRHFRCDCGNERMQNDKCKLRENKQPVNEENQYNQNFRGLYCTCHRPYPEEEENDEVEDEMIQCVICEDWYHGRHLGAPVPANNDYDEMVCGDCMAKHPFLHAYRVHSPVCKVQKEDPGGTTDVDVSSQNIDTKTTQKDGECAGPSSVSCSAATAGQEDAKPDVAKIDEVASVTSSTVSTEVIHQDSPASTTSTPAGQDPASTTEKPAGQAPASITATPAGQAPATPAGQAPAAPAGQAPVTSAEKPAGQAKDIKSESFDEEKACSSCLLSDLQSRGPVATSGAVFWPENWRNKLCVCDNCKNLYAKNKISFLLDPADTVHAYELKGKEKGTHYDRGMQALSNMDRVQQVEVLHGYNDLKDELKDYLKSFADNKRVVREEDIRSFFEQMQARKRQKTGAGMQYFCK